MADEHEYKVHIDDMVRAVVYAKDAIDIATARFAAVGVVWALAWVAVTAIKELT